MSHTQGDSCQASLRYFPLTRIAAAQYALQRLSRYASPVGPPPLRVQIGIYLSPQPILHRRQPVYLVQVPPHRPVVYHIAQLSGQPSLAVLFPSHQIQRGSADQFRLVRLHPVVRQLPWVKMPPVYHVSAVSRLGIRSPIRLDGARHHTLHRRCFFGADGLASTNQVVMTFSPLQSPPRKETIRCSSSVTQMRSLSGCSVSRGINTSHHQRYVETVMPSNGRSVKDLPTMYLRDSNDALCFPTKTKNHL